MAKINSNKFIPQNKTENKGLSSQRVSIASGIGNISSSSLNPSDVKPEGNKNQPKTLLSEVIEIRKNTLSILKIIKGNSSLLKKSEERKRKENERKKFEEKELRSEEKKNKLIPDFKPTEFPKMGFLDRIKQFLFYTLLGAAFTKFGKHIPKVLNFLKLLGPAFKTFETITGNILNGVVDFVGFGYKAYDQVKKIIVGISGDDTEKRLKEFDAQFNKFANLALIAGMAASGSADFSGGGGRKKERLGVDKQTGQKVSKKTQAKYLSQHGEKAYIKRFGKRSYKGLTGKTAGRLAGKALGKVPIIGGLIDFIISTVIFKEKPGRAAAKAVGATIGSALGTFVPVPFAGTILGGILGDIVGGALYDSLVGGDKLKGKAQGGQVTRGGKRVSRPIRRTIKKTRTKPPRIQPQRTIPGKDIGGREEIKKLFPSPTDPRQKNPLGVLETASKNYKEKIPLIGSIMGASIDSTMGQRPDPRTFKKFGTGFGYLIQNAIDGETSGTIASVQNQIVGLANGGVVPRTLSTNENIGMKIGESIGKTLEVMVNSQVNRTLQSIRQQFTKKDYAAPDGGVLGGGETPRAGSISVSSDSKDFWLLAVGSLLENSHPQGAADVAQVIYNRVSSPSWPGTIREVILQGDGGQFQPVRDYGNISAWEGINDKQSALNFIRKYGKGRTQSQLESIASALLNSSRQRSASTFVGPRDSFRATSFEDRNNHLADDTEQRRHGHVFGFEPGGAQIDAFRSGKLAPAQVSQQTTGTVTQLTPRSVSGSIKDTGIRDSSGRPIRLKGIIADAFIDMAASAKKDGINIGSGVSNSFRDPEHNKRVGGSMGSKHLTGEAFDINWNSKAGKWIRNNAGRFGFRHNDYSPKSTHFDWVDGYTPQKQKLTATLTSVPKSTPKGESYLVNGKMYFADFKNNIIKDAQGNEIDVSNGKNRWLLEEISKQRNSPYKSKLNPTLGGNPQASLAPKQISKIAFGLDQQGDYEFAGGVTFISRTRIIEKQVTIPTGGNVVNNNISTPVLNQIQASLASA